MLAVANQRHSYEHAFPLSKFVLLDPLVRRTIAHICCTIMSQNAPFQHFPVFVEHQPACVQLM